MTGDATPGRQHSPESVDRLGIAVALFALIAAATIGALRAAAPAPADAAPQRPAPASAPRTSGDAQIRLEQRFSGPSKPVFPGEVFLVDIGGRVFTIAHG